MLNQLADMDFVVRQQNLVHEDLSFPPPPVEARPDCHIRRACGSAGFRAAVPISGGMVYGAVPVVLRYGIKYSKIEKKAQG
jgi:hypothetical protein